MSYSIYLYAVIRDHNSIVLSFACLISIVSVVMDWPMCKLAADG